MPIEIKELVIKTSINEDQQPGGGSLPDTDMKMIVSTCVEQVMELLKDRDER